MRIVVHENITRRKEAERQRARWERHMTAVEFMDPRHLYGFHPDEVEFAEMPSSYAYHKAKGALRGRGRIICQGLILHPAREVPDEMKAFWLSVHDLVTVEEVRGWGLDDYCRKFAEVNGLGG
jgi:hypothetical protein